MKKFLTIITLTFTAFFANAGDKTINDWGNINSEMHENMSIDYTGNVDIDFLKQMIPHHKGAVEMAKIVLRDSKDPELKKLAKNIIKAQMKEIVWMNERLKRLDKNLGDSDSLVTHDMHKMK